MCRRIPKISDKIRLAAFFGVFQGGMPVAGYYLSNLVNIKSDGWSGVAAFVILLAIGVHMIYEAAGSDDSCDYLRLSLSRLVFLSLATSIDAFATGISFYLLEVNILYAAVVISFVTFFIAAIGAFFGNKLNSYIKRNSEIAGGFILILIGIKFLLETFI
jgi:putative Mn2+ efflux pump MntP